MSAPLVILSIELLSENFASKDDVKYFVRAIQRTSVKLHFIHHVSLPRECVNNLDFLRETLGHINFTRVSQYNKDELRDVFDSATALAEKGDSNSVVFCTNDPGEQRILEQGGYNVWFFENIRDAADAINEC